MEVELQEELMMDKQSSDITPKEWKTATDYALKLAERMTRVYGRGCEDVAVKDSAPRARKIDEPHH
jgi:hypothetical protein